MRTVLLIMTGVGFFLGVVFGLLLQLPIDNTLPADIPQGPSYPLFNSSPFRSRRSLSKLEENTLQEEQQQFPKSHLETNVSVKFTLSQQDTEKDYIIVNTQKQEILGSTPQILIEESELKPKEQMFVLMEALKPSSLVAEVSKFRKPVVSETISMVHRGTMESDKLTDVVLDTKSLKTSHNSDHLQEVKLLNSSQASMMVSVKLNLQKTRNVNEGKEETLKYENEKISNDASHFYNIVNGVLWTPQLEKSCPKPFKVDNADAWKKQVEGLDVVNMVEGCGRMQNRLITFRDASKACARYRLNTDQIQGEIFSYYLARVFNMSNIPPTVLARVETLSSKWRTVHLQISLAQWAETKLVVLTQHIDNLLPAHIPTEFRDEGRRLEPTLAVLGSKTHSQLCELLQWSDLIVFDYLTANLDRVINNMFNSQWNDQMMNSPAHNLEKRADGSLVFLDNESGLFHGYRLLDKYSTFHKTLLQSVCVFRPSTAETIKRLHESSTIGEEIHALFTSSEILHKHLASIPEKNIKILQQRVDDVYTQIIHCQRLFNR